MELNLLFFKKSVGFGESSFSEGTETFFALPDLFFCSQLEPVRAIENATGAARNVVRTREPEKHARATEPHGQRKTSVARRPFVTGGGF